MRRVVERAQHPGDVAQRARRRAPLARTAGRARPRSRAAPSRPACAAPGRGGSRRARAAPARRAVSAANSSYAARSPSAYGASSRHHRQRVVEPLAQLRGRSACGVVRAGRAEGRRAIARAPPPWRCRGARTHRRSRPRPRRRAGRPRRTGRARWRSPSPSPRSRRAGTAAACLSVPRPAGTSPSTQPRGRGDVRVAGGGERPGDLQVGVAPGCGRGRSSGSAARRRRSTCCSAPPRGPGWQAGRVEVAGRRGRSAAVGRGRRRPVVVRQHAAWVARRGPRRTDAVAPSVADDGVREPVDRPGPAAEQQLVDSVPVASSVRDDEVLHRPRRCRPSVGDAVELRRPGDGPALAAVPALLGSQARSSSVSVVGHESSPAIRANQ